MPTKWVNPPTKETATSDVSDQKPTAIGRCVSFNLIKEQVRKPAVSRKSKMERNSEKSVSLAERLGYGTTK